MGQIQSTGWQCDYCGARVNEESPPEWMTLVLTELEPEWIEHAPESDKSVICPMCANRLREFLGKLRSG